MTIAGHDGYVLIRPIFATFSYDLIVDGRSALTGKSALPPLPLPGWAWLFILACIAVPVITRGAAIPTIIGAGCAMLCVHMVQDSSLSRAARAGGALCITTTCWLLFVMFFARGMFK